jgi:hypothetical protein
MGTSVKSENEENPGGAYGHRVAKGGEAVPSGVSEPNLDYLGKGFPALHDVRDNILLLSSGNAFLCEEVFLDKTGKAIESQLNNVRQEIVELKTGFPGKFATEIDTDSIIEDLHAHSQRLQNPDKEIIDECTTGALGRAMEETLDALTTAVRKVKKRVEGETPAYTTMDSVLGVIDKAKTPASMVKRLVSLAVKTVLVLALLSLGPLTYLILSMDRADALQKEIAESEAIIQSQKDRIGSLERERATIWQRIEFMKADDLPREAKFEIMEMSVKLHSLDQNRHMAEAEISAHEERMRINKQRLQEVTERPFLDRLMNR